MDKAKHVAWPKKILKEVNKYRVAGTIRSVTPKIFCRIIMETIFLQIITTKLWRARRRVTVGVERVRARTQARSPG